MERNILGFVKSELKHIENRKISDYEKKCEIEKLETLIGSLHFYYLLSDDNTDEAINYIIQYKANN